MARSIGTTLIVSNGHLMRAKQIGTKQDRNVAKHTPTGLGHGGTKREKITQNYDFLLKNGCCEHICVKYSPYDPTL